MNNILLDPLPTEYEGCRVNTSFRIGIQLCLLQEEVDLSATERYAIIRELLFGEPDGNIRKTPENLHECIKWYLTGWEHDNHVPSEEPNKRMMDYDIDQYRIYADFLKIYGIDLNTADMHWWVFQGLLWNMPHEQSSFMQCLEIRGKKPRKNASTEERNAISKAHKRFDLPERPKVYTSEEERKIDEFDRMREEAKKNKGG